ncbi:MAG: indolepyruvate oxidoreductase subunit beta [Mucinivorans sp.]
MNKNIILSGVGGQGILSIAAIIGQAALRANLYIKQAEVHGMSQRGGDVQSNLRISSKPIHSDLIARGTADLIIALEPMEALRYVPYLAAEGWVVANSAPFCNIPSYPDQEAIIGALNGRGNTILLNVDELAAEHKLERSANMILLGATSLVLGIDFNELEQGIQDVFGAKGSKVVEQNLRALALGQHMAKQDK